jgi:hypothetical protein
MHLILRPLGVRFEAFSSPEDCVRISMQASGFLVEGENGRTRANIPRSELRFKINGDSPLTGKGSLLVTWESAGPLDTNRVLFISDDGTRWLDKIQAFLERQN